MLCKCSGKYIDIYFNLKITYDNFGASKAATLPGFHCITGCDTCGHIRNVGKKLLSRSLWKPHQMNSMHCLNLELKKRHLMILFLVVNSFVSAYEQKKKKKRILCKMAEELRWKCFKNQSRGIDSIPPTSGAWRQHILRAHLQAFIWNQAIAQHPVIPGPFKMGWSCAADNIPVPVCLKYL